MSRTLRILQVARSDVDEIFNWLLRRSVRGAISWYLAFRAAIRAIASSPQAFGEAPESQALGRPLYQTLIQNAPGKNLSGDFRIL